MKRLIIVGGTMGVGKTTVCQKLKYELENAVFLDGDWCWDMHPFIVNDETKEMVMNNIAYQINSFLHCSHIENIIFCWVLHQQEIIDNLIQRLDLKNVQVYPISLVCSRKKLVEQLEKDIEQGIRQSDVIERSLERMKCYEILNTIKVNKTDLTIEETLYKIKEIISSSHY